MIFLFRCSISLFSKATLHDPPMLIEINQFNRIDYLFFTLEIPLKNLSNKDPLLSFVTSAVFP